MTACPEGRWWDALPDIAQGFCQLPYRATGLSPVLLQHKQYPELAPAEGLLVNVDEDTSWEEVAQDIEYTLNYWQEMFGEIKRRLI